MIDKGSISLRHSSALGSGQVNEGTATLLRKVMGLPGDPGVCEVLENREVRLNACAALHQPGAELPLWILGAVSKRARHAEPVEDDPVPGPIGP